MKTNTVIVVIIPAVNEENSIARVVNEIPAGLVDEIIVCDNGSHDNTADNARLCGATVVYESRKGYGWACLKGMEHLEKRVVKPDIVVFIDGDYSDYPDQMPALVAPILNGSADFVIGSRALGNREKGSMTFPQVFGNWLATRLMRIFYQVRYSDLGPFRAIRYDALLKLGMKDKTYGWTIEMQIKAAKNKLPYTEVPVNYKKRIGVSKVSGTIKGTILAGYKIIFSIFKYLR
ncbi:MAG: glycosyltransferase family 2 protein [Crocinitomicaceae bacterium]|nr:glycosyltransferase family 2 protein [Crocinitomicaceae bacterium]